MIENNTLKKINIKKPIKVRQNIVLSETLTFKLLFIVLIIIIKGLVNNLCLLLLV